jgi:hypothetical protein
VAELKAQVEAKFHMYYFDYQKVVRYMQRPHLRVFQ